MAKTPQLILVLHCFQSICLIRGAQISIWSHTLVLRRVGADRAVVSVMSPVLPFVKALKQIFPYSGQISDLQVKADDENVPGHPHHQPGCVLQRQIIDHCIWTENTRTRFLTELTGIWSQLEACLRACQTHPGDISRPELDRAEQAEYDNDDVQEVGEDGSPLVAQEIYHLTLQHADLRRKRRNGLEPTCRWTGAVPFSQGSGFSQLKSRRDGRWWETCDQSHTPANLK